MDLIQTSHQNMQKVIDVLKNDLSSVRVGKASPHLVENIVVNAYQGTQKLRIVELAQIHASDSQTLVITPFDGSIIGEIHKAILESNTGYTPIIDAGIIRISIPPLSEERRQQLVLLVNQKLEGGKVQIRQLRHDVMNDLKKMLEAKEVSEDESLRFEKEIQRNTDETIASIDALGKQKEQELMAI